MPVGTGGTGTLQPMSARADPWEMRSLLEGLRALGRAQKEKKTEPKQRQDY